MSRRRPPGEVASLAAEALAVWAKHSLVQPLRSKPPRPRAMHFISTHRCNARCVMCGIWKETPDADAELSPEAFETILADRLFAKIEFVGISGGEPFVRDDLRELCRVVLRRCPRVRRISLTTNGLLSKRMRDGLPGIAGDLGDAGVLLDVSVSVHGMGEALDEIYGTSHAFEKIERTVGVLEELRDEERLSLSMNCVLLADNLAAADELRSWAANRNIPLSFVIGEHRPRFRTDGLDDAFVQDDDRSELIAFLQRLADDPGQSSVASDKYREIASMLEGGTDRTLSCYYAMGGLVLGHDGRLFYCSHSDEIGNCLEESAAEIYFDSKNLEYRKTELLGAECRGCPPYTRTRWEIEKDLPRTLAGMVGKALTRSREGT